MSKSTPCRQSPLRLFRGQATRRLCDRRTGLEHRHHLHEVDRRGFDLRPPGLEFWLCARI